MKLIVAAPALIACACAQGETLLEIGSSAVETSAASVVSPSESALATVAAESEPSASASVAQTQPSVSWLGVPLEGAPRIEKKLTYFGASFDLAEGYRKVELGNGMSEGTEAVMAYFPAPVQPAERWGAARKYAAIILLTHGTTHDSLVTYGAMRWLGLSANVGDDTWSPPMRATLPRSQREVELVRGKGTLDNKPAELWQLRDKYPGPKPASGYTALLVGALRADAPREAREAFYASLASYEPVK